ncbi:glycoside hydrolase family 31 protein [Mucilaginibacter sp. dw_454]|uniref:glycoside hydrolase family 31 protein n=1 Tax=Mucilaginibacter sp. dw_454 TaxID=2720079 RepID=UPI001BD6432C|nr:glycoside hydrolase family 31 protein [Mucilaginibacter sp. dw_454]
MQIEILGNADSVTEHDNSLLIKTAQAQARVWVFSPTIIRICVTKNSKEPDESFAVIEKSLEDFTWEKLYDTVEVTTSALKLVIDLHPLRFNFLTADGQPLSEDDNRFGVNWQAERVINYRKLYPDEKFLGLGEKAGDLNRRGCNYVNWNTDAAMHTITTDPLYKTFPFFIGLHSGLTYGLFFDNTHKSYFDFGATTDEQMSWFGADGGDMNYYFFGAQGLRNILEDYTWLTGRMEMPPLWSLGYQQCRWSYMSADEVLDIARKFRERNIPADVMYCDIDYMDEYKIFTWNKETFTNPKGMIDQLKDMNFRLVTIIDPGIKIDENYKEYKEGVERGYFATYPDGELYTGSVWPGRCHFPDFFNEEVREWWGAAFEALADPGVEGFWNDMNEPAAWGQNMPWLVKFGERFMPEVRNAYGMQMARGTYYGTKRILKGKRPFILTRAAYAGTQRYSAVWTGDNAATDEHMLFGQRLVNSLGLAGMSMIGVDIGGFMGNPTPELMVRWNSLGPYVPMFRNHAALGMSMREPWQWGEAYEQIIKKDIEQRYKLLPYIYSGFYESTQTGLPLARTLAIDYTTDENIYDTRFQNQFLFGDSILVAPVVSTAETVEVYLPAGDWYRLSSDEKFKGNQIVNVASPLTDLPVFVKAGGIVPMQNVIQNTNEIGDGILQVHIWNGNEVNSFVYYEDDGTTYSYQDGAYYKRTITFDPQKKEIVFGAVEGSHQSKYLKLRVIWHGFEGANVVEMENVNAQINIGF